MIHERIELSNSLAQAYGNNDLEQTLFGKRVLALAVMPVVRSKSRTSLVIICLTLKKFVFILSNDP